MEIKKLAIVYHVLLQIAQFSNVTKSLNQHQSERISLLQSKFSVSIFKL